MGILAFTQSLFLGVGVSYVLLVGSLMLAPVQRNLIFLHNVRLPRGADYDRPEKYGLSPHKTVNFRINTAGGISLGSWFTFSDPYFRSPGFDSSDIPTALKSYPTVLYLHGNAATRAVSSRVSVYSTFSSRLHVNVLAIDYRGFGDTPGTPTEEGTVQDALAAFDWLVSQGANPKDVIVVGHSLGAAIAAQMTSRLERDRNIKPRGLVILSGFASISNNMEDLKLLGLPILAPMRYIPGGWEFLMKFTYTHFVTLDHIQYVTSPIVIGHARDDEDNLWYNSLMIFDKLMEPMLPPAPPSFQTLPPTTSQAEFEAIRSQHQERKRCRDALVRTSRVRGDAITRHEFQRGEKSVQTVFVDTLWGGHGPMPLQEGLQDVIKEVFNLGERLS